MTKPGAWGTRQTDAYRAFDRDRKRAKRALELEAERAPTMGVVLPFLCAGMPHQFAQARGGQLCVRCRKWEAL